jgi:hypothetical protein
MRKSAFVLEQREGHAGTSSADRGQRGEAAGAPDFQKMPLNPNELYSPASKLPPPRYPIDKLQARRAR